MGLGVTFLLSLAVNTQLQLSNANEPLYGPGMLMRQDLCGFAALNFWAPPLIQTRLERERAGKESFV